MQQSDVEVCRKAGSKAFKRMRLSHGHVAGNQPETIALKFQPCPKEDTQGCSARGEAAIWM